MNIFLKEAMKQKGLSGNKLAFKTFIAPSDLSQAINGKKPFFPSWRKRISEVLGIPESVLFPEYSNTKEDQVCDS